MTFEETLRLALPNLDSGTSQRRTDVERRLAANVRQASIFTASINQDRETYRIVTAGGTEFAKVTLAEADMLCSVAMSAYNEGRSDA